MSEDKWKNLKELWRDIRNNPQYRSSRVYFGSAFIVVSATFFASVFSASLPNVSIELSAKIMENVIRLDGVLFGFTAVMLTLIHVGKGSVKTKFSVTFLSAVSFFCYLLSIFMGFSNLMWQNQSNQIFVPVMLTCFGGFCSSIYVIMMMLQMEK